MRIWLDRAVVDRLRALRGPSESFSDVILRLAANGKPRGGVDQEN
jgi:predicted CopG family antitoxin